MTASTFLAYFVLGTLIGLVVAHVVRAAVPRPPVVLSVTDADGNGTRTIDVTVQAHTVDEVRQLLRLGRRHFDATAFEAARAAGPGELDA